MFSTNLKIASAIAGVGAVGGGVALGVHLLNKENPNALKFKLVSEGFNTEVSDTEWNEILNAHNIDGNTNVFKPKIGETKDKDWIKNKCYEALNNEDKDNANYKLAIQWCVKPEKVSDILGKTSSKFRVLNTLDNEATIDKSFWKTIIESLATGDNKSKLGVELNGRDEDAKIKEVKGKCRETNALKTTSKDFVAKFELAKQWCSVTKQG